MTDSSPEVVWRRSPQVAFVDDGQRVVLLDLTSPTTARPQLLNTTAASIWRDLGEGRTVLDIVANLSLGATQPREAVIRDVCRFLRELEGAGIVRVDASP